MKHSQVPPITDASVAFLTSRPKSKTGSGFLAAVTAALHESRRLQAARAVRQHRHLVRREPAGGATRTNGVPSPQVLQIVRDAKKPSAQPGARMSFYSKLIIAIVVAGFAVLHFVADGTLRQASATQPTEDRMLLPDRD